jgi:hypothetical protein
LVAARRTAASSVVESALGPFFAGEIGVTIDLGRVLSPSGQEELFQVKFGFWGAAHLWLLEGPVVLCVRF